MHAHSFTTSSGVLLPRKTSVNRPHPHRSIVAEVEGCADQISLSVTEDPFCYYLMAEFPCAATDNFEVELYGSHVEISMVRESLPSNSNTSANSEPAAIHNQLDSRKVSLEFPIDIDAMASSGEIAEGLLRLSLRKKLLQGRR